MAIYHLSVKIISRSSGRSATASAAYRAGEKIFDIRTGEIHDYTKKKGVDEQFILAPNSAPDWVFNREQLWNSVERVERRKDSQLAREINVALPTELTTPQQLELVKEFVTDQFVNQGMVADVALHNLSSHNPHAHIMLTMRNIDEHGFNPKKNLDWNKRQLLEKQRLAWATHTNNALEKAGVNQKVDHRSLEAQGVNRIPQIHLGANVAAMMKRGIATERGEQWLAIESANRQIASYLRQITTVEHQITATESQGKSPEKRALASSLSPTLERYSTKPQTSSDPTQKLSPTKNTPDLTDAQLIEAWQFLQTWRDRQPKESNSEFLTLQQNILRLSQLESQLIQDVTAQQQWMSEIQQLISVDSEVLDPEGSISSKPRQKLKQFISHLARTQTQLSEAKSALANFHFSHQKAQLLESTLSSPTYQSRLQFLRSSYHLFAQCQFILKHLGRTQKDNQSLYFQGKNYRFEQSGTTITISHRERTKPLFVATDHRETGGIIDIHSFNVHSEDINTITNLVQHLEADLQQQQKQARERGLSL